MMRSPACQLTGTSELVLDDIHSAMDSFPDGIVGVTTSLPVHKHLDTVA